MCSFADGPRPQTPHPRGLLVLPSPAPLAEQDFLRLAMRLRSVAPRSHEDEPQTRDIDEAPPSQPSWSLAAAPAGAPEAPATPRRAARRAVPRLRGCHVADVPGLRLIYDVLTEDEEAAALFALETDRGWPASNIHTATQWGWRFSTWNRAPPLQADDWLQPLPQWQRALIAAMLRADPGREFMPSRSEWLHGVEHALLNCYHPGDGVSPHTDDLHFWTGCVFQLCISQHACLLACATMGRWVLGLSLGSDVTMLFHPPASGEPGAAAAPVAVRLPARSLYVLTGDARWTYRHEIVRAAEDWVDGAAVPRRYRASVTWRGISEAWLPRALADAQNKRDAAC